MACAGRTQRMRSALLVALLLALLLLALSVTVSAADEDVPVTVEIDEVVMPAVDEAGEPVEVKIVEVDVMEDATQDEPSLTEEEARRIVEETEAEAARLAEEARAASSIKEPRTYGGVGAIHTAAKVRPEGCAAVTQDYLTFMSTHVAAANARVRRARAEVNEARSHAPNKLHNAEKALAKAEEDADKVVLTALQDFGGDMQKTCIDEVEHALQDQMARAREMNSRFLSTWSHHFALLQGSAMMLWRTGEGVVHHLADVWRPTYEAAWDFTYRYTEKALSAFNEARTPARDGAQQDLATYLGHYARGFGYALVPILTGAVGAWVVLIFWPLLLLGLFAPSFFCQVWWRVFILWNMYGLTFPKGYLNALGEYKTMLVSGNYNGVLDRSADAFFDVVGDDADATFYNGLIVLFVLCGALMACLVLVLVWLTCFTRCAGMGRRRRQAPSLPRRTRPTTTSPARPQKASKAAATSGANAAKKKKN